jgi:hypothetical protein
MLVRRLRPADLYTTVYLAFGLVVLIMAPHRPANAPFLIAAHVVAIAAIVLARAYRVDRWTVGAAVLG